MNIVKNCPVICITNATVTSSPGRAAPDEQPLMPEVAALQFSGDPGAMLAALTMTTAKNEANTSRALRDEAMKAQDAAETAEINDLRDKADLQRVQGVVDGLCDFAQAGMDVAQGQAKLDSTLDTAHADALDRDIKAAGGGVPDEVRNANVEAEKMFRNEGAHEEACSSGWKAGSEFIGGAKQIADGMFQGAVTDKDADEKMHEAAASSFKNMVDDFRDDEKDAKELMSKAMDFYKEYSDTKSQTAMAATHRA